MKKQLKKQLKELLKNEIDSIFEYNIPILDFDAKIQKDLLRSGYTRSYSPFSAFYSKKVGNISSDNVIVEFNLVNLRFEVLIVDNQGICYCKIGKTLRYKTTTILRRPLGDHDKDRTDL
jgi:hypothetical protein